MMTRRDDVDERGHRQHTADVVVVVAAVVHSMNVVAVLVLVLLVLVVIQNTGPYQKEAQAKNYSMAGAAAAAAAAAAAEPVVKKGHYYIHQYSDADESIVDVVLVVVVDETEVVDEMEVVEVVVAESRMFHQSLDWHNRIDDWCYQNRLDLLELLSILLVANNRHHRITVELAVAVAVDNDSSPWTR
jgi:hypothetical protein